MLPESESHASYRRYIVPTPGRPFFQGAFGIQAGVNWKNQNRAPLLLIAGDKDKTIAPGMVSDTYKKQQRSTGVTAFKTFPNRSHFLILERGWEEVADYAIDWALSSRIDHVFPTLSQEQVARVATHGRARSLVSGGSLASPDRQI